jgi:hypothetical protein
MRRAGSRAQARDRETGHEAPFLASVSVKQTGKGGWRFVPLFVSVGAGLSSDTEAAIEPVPRFSKELPVGQSGPFMAEPGTFQTMRIMQDLVLA